MADYLSLLKNPAQAQAFINAVPGGQNEFDRLKAGNPAWQPEVWASEHFKSMQAQGQNPEQLRAPVPASLGQLFDMPTLTPESGTTTSTATGATTSAGTSGIDWSSPGVAGLLDQIKNWTGIASGNAANAPGNINNFYSNMMRNALQPEAFQGTLNNLRQRNMLDSSVASDALAGTASNIAGQVGNQALSSYLKGFDVQQGMPGMLGQLASTLGGRGTTSTGTNTATGTQTDPMAAYRLAFGYV